MRPTLAGVAEEGAHDHIAPPINRVELSEWVRHSREDAARHDARLSTTLAPRIEAHVLTYRRALDAIESAHQSVADQTDFDLKGETQWAAIWQVAGRSIGFARGLLALAAEGYGDEALPMARAAHESNRMLQAVSDPEEMVIVQRWLEDHNKRYVRAGDARDAVERIEQRMNERMKVAGAEPLGTTIGLSRQLYHRMSLVAHIRRQGIEQIVSSKLRRMSRGRHPDPVGRALAVESHGRVVEETVSLVGDSLSRFFGAAFYDTTLRPMLASFEAVREAAPLDPDTLRSMR